MFFQLMHRWKSRREDKESYSPKERRPEKTGASKPVWMRTLSHPLSSLILAILLVVLDLSTGPEIHFPVLFVLPIAMAASRSLLWGVSLAVLLALARLPYLWMVPDWTWQVALPNVSIKLTLFGLVAFLVHRSFRLKERVRELEDYLFVCAWCKRIRDEDRQWISLEQFLTQNSETKLSHGICPDCSRKMMQE